MKKIILNTNNNNTNNTNNINNDNKREIIKSAVKDTSLCIFIEECILNYDKQFEIIKNIYNNYNFYEKKFVISELKKKMNSYKSQDQKKDIHEYCNLITINNIIEKLYFSQLKCYYCNCNVCIIFENIRFKKQWTLDRLNNLDEHTNKNTIIACLECNLQRRRKNSDKFLFTKKLETNQIKINKII